MTAKYILSTILKYAPGKLWLELLIKISGNILQVFSVVWLLNHIISMLGQGQSFLDVFWVLLIFLVLHTICAWIKHCYQQYWSPQLEIKVCAGLDMLLMEKAEKLPLAAYENTRFYALLKQARECSESTFFLYFANLTDMISYFAALISAVMMLIDIDPWMLLAALFAIPMLLVGKQFGKRMGKKQTALIEIARMKDYAGSMLLSKERAREIRTSNAGKISQKYAQTGMEQSNKIHDTYGKELFGWQFLLQSVSITLIAIISYAYGILRFAYTEDFTTAAFSVMFVAIMNMVSRCSRITKCFEKEANYRVKIEAMQKFFALEPEPFLEDSLKPGKFESLEFRDVTFAYTADEEPVLNHVSFRICAGERIAIAGYNGAGKSTLVKLMLRFYDPTEGVILYNGVDIRMFDPAEYRKVFAAVFQDFYLFSIGVGENVLLGEYDQSKAGKVQDALASAGLDLADEQYERIIGREYDAVGMVFSGGQQQKIAFARLAAKEYDFAILDEPTAAMDPISEEKLFESLLALNENRTLLLITHRLSATQRMDRILMFEKGCLVEEGSHGELLAKDGVYAKYYHYQAMAYQKRVREQL